MIPIMMSHRDEIRCAEGFAMGPILIDLWRPIHVSLHLSYDTVLFSSLPNLSWKLAVEPVVDMTQVDMIFTLLCVYLSVGLFPRRCGSSFIKLLMFRENC